MIPFVFGLIGFFEPCSLGINIIFLHNMQRYHKAKRVFESLVFMFSRGIVLALVGLSAAFIGKRFVKVQGSLFLILGMFFIVLGILSIINIYRPIFAVNLDFSRYVKNRAGLRLGLAFGLVIPACATALVLALVGKTMLIGDLVEGFVSLFVFGATLSLPLVFISYSEKSTQIIRKFQEKNKKLSWLAGAILILVGMLTISSSSWWLKAI
ncbi:MAG: cytochrome c biogenesis CcdA family protein [Candidatus Hydrothermarchaeales archaeon]